MRLLEGHLGNSRSVHVQHVVTVVKKLVGRSNWCDARGSNTCLLAKFCDSASSACMEPELLAIALCLGSAKSDLDPFNIFVPDAFCKLYGGAEALVLV